MDVVMMSQAVGRQVAAETDRLLTYLENLPEEDWKTPSACEGWTVRQVVNHLGTGVAFFKPMIASVIEGKEIPPFSPEARQATADKFEAYSNQEIIKELGTENQAMAGYFAKATAEQLNTLIPLFGGQMPLVFLSGLRLTEAAIHSWDIYSAENPDATLDAASAKLLLPNIFRMMPRFMRQTEIAELNAKYRFNLSDSHFSPVVVEFVAGEATPRITTGAEAEGAAAGALVVNMTEEQFLRLVWGRLDLGKALEQGDVTYQSEDDGAFGKVLHLKSIFKGI